MMEFSLANLVWPRPGVAVFGLDAAARPPRALDALGAFLALASKQQLAVASG
jgi:hypothetical protein